MEPAGPLGAAELESFVREGYCLLRGAFPTEVAEECRDALWTRAGQDGIVREDRSTWNLAPKGRLGIAESYRRDELGAPWHLCWSARLRAALDQLCGAGRWAEGDGCGWWVLTFPGVAEEPWGAEGSWHVDGHGYRHFAHSKEIGALPIFLFSDVDEHGGGTALMPGSHLAVARILLKAGKRGLSAAKVSQLARDECIPSDALVETRGRAGDVMLTHPFLLHARSKNLQSTVRFMCHPSVPLKDPMRIFAEDEDGTLVAAPRETATPVEAAILDAHAAMEPTPQPFASYAPRQEEEEENDMGALMGFQGFGKRRRR